MNPVSTRTTARVFLTVILVDAGSFAAVRLISRDITILEERCRTFAKIREPFVWHTAGLFETGTDMPCSICGSDASLCPNILMA